MPTRAKTFAFAVVAWVLLNIVNWALNLWLDNNVTSKNLAEALTLAQGALSTISGKFGFGFIVGAAVFSSWDWPLLGNWLRKQRLRSRNKDDDERLAQECDELSKYLYDEAAAIERSRSERHFRSNRLSAETMHDSWSEARVAEAREEERIRKHVGHKVQRLFSKLHARGVKLDLWGFSLSHYDLSSASYFLIELADALRNGSYLEREFQAGRSGARLPARM